MRSFVLGYIEKKENCIKKEDNCIKEKVPLDLHINLWRDSSETNNSYSVDVGLMIYDIRQVKEVHLYIPFKVRGVEDLGRKLASNSDLLSAIFNEPYSINAYVGLRKKITQEQEQESESNKNTPFILYKLQDSNFTLKEIEDYSLLIVDLKDILSDQELDNNSSLEKCKKYYFRFRIIPENLDNIIKKENAKVNPLTIIQDPTLYTTETLDFRINELRSCPETLKESYLRAKKFELNAIHYLIIRKSSDDFINVDGKILKSRLLENEIWKEYLPQGISHNKNMIAYHYKDKSKEGKKIDTYTNLSQFRYLSMVTKRLFYYLILGVILALCTSLIYDLVRFILLKVYEM